MEENRINEQNKNIVKHQEWDRKREEAIMKKDEIDEAKYRRLTDQINVKEEKERNKR